MSAAVLCIGTELTRGELLNSNATWLAEALTTIGLEVTSLDCVDDDRARIEAALRRLVAEHQVVICTGGLGPTTDDITTECAARSAGVGLRRDEASLQHIRDLHQRFGRTMVASNAKQADFPEGASVINNPNGTAPGFWLKLSGCTLYFLPGVPREMKAMFEASLAPGLAAFVSVHRHQLVLRSYGLPEAEVNDLLAGLEAEFGVVIGYRATLPEIEIKLLAQAESVEAAKVATQRAAAAVRTRLGEHVFGEGFTSLPDRLGELLEQSQLTLALAESCTGGLAAELLTGRAGSSRYFLGAAVTYSNPLKTALLGVPAELIAAHGAVSAEVARAMAEGARSRLGADVGLSFTGIAGPGGGSEQKPVGLVHFAVATAAGTVNKQRVFVGSRNDVRRRAAFAGFDLVRRSLG